MVFGMSTLFAAAPNLRPLVEQLSGLLFVSNALRHVSLGRECLRSFCVSHQELVLLHVAPRKKGNRSTTGRSGSTVVRHAVRVPVVCLVELAGGRPNAVHL